jgi:hypothetical protein
MVLTEERATESVRSAPSDGNAVAAPVRLFAARHADGLAVLAVLAVSLSSAAWFTRSFYYFQDDFIFVRQAQTSSLSVSYLRGSLIQHFSPVSRLLDYVLANWLNSNVAAAHTIELVLLAASVLAFSWTITELVGRHWWRHVLTLGFAESLPLLHLLGWWTATANILPATLFGLLTIAAFFRYRRLGNRKWIAVSLLSYGFSLCTHEQSWLVVGYLVLFDFLVFAPHRRFREALVRLRREGWVWLGYMSLTILAAINYFEFYYAPLKPRATIGALAHYIGIQFTQSFAPSAVGLRPLTTGWTNTVALVFDSLVFAAIVIVSIYRRPSAWRVWTVFGIGFLTNSIMIGANRVGFFGVDFGKQLYYLQAPAYLFLLCVGAAFSLDRSGAPYVMRQEVPIHPRVTTHLRRPSQRFRSGLLTALVLGVGLYAVAFATSATTMTVKDQSNLASGTARSYFTRLVGQIDTASSHGGQVAVLDATVPDGAVASAFFPWNRLSFALPVVRPGVVVDQLREHTFAVRPDGTLVAQKFLRSSGTSLGLPIAAVVGISGVTVSGAPRRAVADHPCFSSTRPGGTIDVRLVSPLTSSDAWLLIGLTSSSGGTVNVSTVNNGVSGLLGSIDLAASSKPNFYLLPLSPQTLDQVEISALAIGENMCISSVDVGRFSPSGNNR